jgi:hypothetical protein
MNRAFSGGGISLVEREPAYQLGVQATGMRTIPDVAAPPLPLETGVPQAKKAVAGTLVAEGLYAKEAEAGSLRGRRVAVGECLRSPGAAGRRGAGVPSTAIVELSQRNHDCGNNGSRAFAH